MTAQLAAPQITPAHPERGGRTATPVIAFLGAGRMGGPMAATLARAGFSVRAWDRTVSRAAASGHADDDLAAIYTTP
jgi:3-hydroxyisobutyrate dehydrogenase